MGENGIENKESERGRAAEKMEPRKFTVTFLPMNQTIEVEEETSLLDIALDHGVELEHNCGGNCACATCHVIIKEGMACLSPKSEEEEDQLDEADGLTLGSRLACQAIVKGNVVVQIPDPFGS